MKKYTLEEFCNSRYVNLWTSPVPHMNVYIRKATHLHPLTKVPLKCFDIANVVVEDDKQHQGIFTAWLAEVIAFATRRGFDAVHVENVLTDRFADYFRRDGKWIETSHLTPSFFHILREPTVACKADSVYNEE